MSTRRTTYLLLLIAVFLFVVGCGPSQDEIAVTVENQVNTAVVSTLTAVPTYTPYPTQTAYPTHTPYPTATIIPTYTPYPTYTPEPSFTPTATFTPEPSATATATLAPIREESVSSGDATAQSGDFKTQLLAEIDKTRAEVELYSWTISIKYIGEFEFNKKRDANIDCQATVNLFDSVASVLVVDVASSDPVIQNAYGLYLTAVNQFKELTTPWTDGCREALAAGETHKQIGENQSETLRVWIEEQSTNLLRQAINSLSE